MLKIFHIFKCFYPFIRYVSIKRSKVKNKGVCILTDKEISKKILKGDTSVFDYLMDNYNKLLWLVIGNILETIGTAEDIEDCISEVYLKLMENPKGYDYKLGSIKSFLVKTGKNCAIDKCRQLAKSNIIELDVAMHTQSHDEDILASVIDTENKTALLEAISLLKEPGKEILIRRYFFDEKPKEIAQKMQLNVKDVENKLYQGKLKIKKHFEHAEVYYG